MTGTAPRAMPPTAPNHEAVPRLMPERDDDETEVHQLTQHGIVIGVPRAPAPAAAQQPAAGSEAAPVAPAVSPHAPTAETSTHRGLPAVPREPGPTSKDYVKLLARHGELERQHVALEERYEEMVERTAALLDFLERHAGSLERQLSTARQRADERDAELAALRAELRRSLAARDALLLVVQELALDPPETELFRRMAAAALAAIAEERATQSTTTPGAPT